MSECLGPPSIVEGVDNLEKVNSEPAKEEQFFDDNFDEDLANLNYEELALLDTKVTTNSEAGGRNLSLDNIFCNNNLTNTTVNINVTLSK